MYGEPKIVSIDTEKKKRLELCPFAGAYQGVAYSFTIRFELNELSFEEEIND